ncbi:MAG TPA: hypothetical protein VEM32_02000 [Geobacteraceae bacterium]|nr:hypothetical protein [Geobacteraceae bacterium]
MHCACPTFEGFLLLPPFNTLRAQVIVNGGAQSGYTVTYAMVENTDANLQADPYFASWIANSPKMFPGFKPVVSGKVYGITGNGLAGTMKYDSTSGAYIALGIPAYPALDSKGVMTDPLGGPNRNPFLTANIIAKDSTGKVVASTSTVVPVAFGGCCSCHLKLAAANGYPATPAGSFALLGVMHAKNSSGINIAMIDPDGDGVGGPVRCSWCHWDPAMLESAAPGWPAGTKLLPGATFTLKKSVYSFSDVLHRFHNNSAVVKSQYDANIATNCYDCHPGNNVNCYRGAHKGKTQIWCVDCHGNLTQRVATNQLKQPWQQSTLPSCAAPSPGITSAFACHGSSYAGGSFAGLFGKFINGKFSKGNLLCETCHGQPHAEAPSTVAVDNVQLKAANAGAVFPSGKDASYAFGKCSICHSSKTQWGSPHNMN